MDPEVWEKFAAEVSRGFAAVNQGGGSILKDMLQAFPLRHGGKTYQAFFYAVLIDADRVPDAGLIVDVLESLIRRVLEYEARKRGKAFRRDDILRGVGDV